MASFSHSIAVDVPPTSLWALVSDVQRVAALFPYTTVEDCTNPEPERWLFWRRLAIPNIADLHWREQATVIAPLALEFRAIEGDLATFAGRWQVETHGTATTLVLNLNYEIPSGLAPKMPAMLLEYVMGEIFRTICQRIKEAAEETAA